MIDDDARQLIRVALAAMSLVFGASGVFFLWASFYAPEAGIVAALSLGTASAINLLTPQ